MDQNRARFDVALDDESDVHPTPDVRLRAALEAGGIGTWTYDLGSGVTTWDAVTARIVGCPSGSGAVEAVEASVEPEDRVALAAWIAAMAGGTLTPIELRHKRRDGAPRRSSLSGYLEYDAHGTPVTAVGVVIDVTERRRSERRRGLEAAVSRILVESDTLADAGPHLLGEIAAVEGCRLGIIWLVDRDANVLRAAEIWNNDPLTAPLADRCRNAELRCGEELPGVVWAGAAAKVTSRLRPEEGERAVAALQAGLSGALAFPIVNAGAVTGVIELYGRTADILDLDLRSVLVAIGERIGQFVARRQSEAVARRVVALSPNVLYALVVEPDELRVSWISGNFERLFGSPPDELGERAQWIDRIHPDDQLRVEAAMALPYEIDHQVLEYRFLHADGSYCWVRDEKQLVRDASGRPTDLIGTWSDVTERVQLEEQLRQSQKMEAIGVLAGGVAHDFNNLLTVIGCSTELLRSMVPPSDPRAELLTEIASAADRGAALTRQLLLFSRAQVAAPTTFDPNQILRGIEKMLRRLIGEDIKLITRLDPEVGILRMDAGQLEQVVLNLVVNARDAMPRGGELSIATRIVEMDHDPARRRPDAQPGRHVAIEIRDTGIGMSAEVMTRIFEPFFTTKGVGKGTGLGLATAFGIVHAAGGHIEVTSAPGDGATFLVYLPTTCGTATSETRAEQAQGGNETILLVEDEPSVRRATHRALTRAGYRVLEASGPETALALALAHPDFDLLLTDVVMPAQSGCELAATLISRHPELPVLFISGYIDDAIVRHGVASSDAFLNKPFTPDALLHKVRELLSRRAERA